MKHLGVVSDHKMAAPPRDSRDSDQRLAARWQWRGARHGGTTMPSIAAPSHTSAARRGAPGVEVHSRGRAGLAGGAKAATMEVRVPPQLNGEGGQLG